jgi:hypothetical protein
MRVEPAAAERALQSNAKKLTPTPGVGVLQLVLGKNRIYNLIKALVTTLFLTR